MIVLVDSQIWKTIRLKKIKPIERINNLQVNWLLKSLKDFVRSDAMNSTQCEDPPECVSLDINRIKKREKLISILENENVPAEPDKWKQLI